MARIHRARVRSSFSPSGGRIIARYAADALFGSSEVRRGAAGQEKDSRAAGKRGRRPGGEITRSREGRGKREDSGANHAARANVSFLPFFLVE
jgi:hypothetical protein